ncbi:MAG TPA: acetyl-CoA C-acetyltransferase [Bdellovibrionota bacterium]|jgi:acetyl-CoA C-acetyltransferase
MKKVVVAGGARIPFCRAGSSYANVGNQELMTASVKAVVEKFRLNGKTVGDVALGGVMNHSSDWNMAREVALGSNLAPETPAFGLQRACGTSLEASILIANKIALGQIECGIAGGFDSMSDVPIELSHQMAKTLVNVSRARTLMDRVKIFSSIRPSYFKPHFPAVTEPRTGLSMGEHCELMAQEWKLSQAEQDELALASHKNAAKAWAGGFYKDLVVSFSGAEKDNNVRGDTTLEKLAKLKPAFERSSKGTLTAGNSSPLTDGSAAVLLCSEDFAKAHSLPIQAYFVDCEVSAVDFLKKKEGLLMAPAYAVPRMLARRGIKLQDFDLYEIHEAFAAQVLCTLKAWDSDDFCRGRLGLGGKLGSIDRSKMNVVGGSVALGHPFGATGARLVATLGKLLEQKGKGRGLISVCTGGGMGVTAILERP